MLYCNSLRQPSVPLQPLIRPTPSKWVESSRAARATRTEIATLALPVETRPSVAEEQVLEFAWVHEMDDHAVRGLCDLLISEHDSALMTSFAS